MTSHTFTLTNHYSIQTSQSQTQLLRYCTHQLNLLKMHTLFTFLCIRYSLFYAYIIHVFYYAHEFIRKKRQKKESLNQVNEQLEQEGSESSSLTHS